ncbi:MAG: aspartate aminotransferase family protein [Chloroflexi bacterium]|nr:aspartate aminotransferase family protein [Chloroflexota bacterium]
MPNSAQERFEREIPRSRAAYERARAVMPGGAKGAYFYAPFPLTLERGEGCYLFDVDEHRYADFAGHHTAQVLGHGHPAVLAAVQAQLTRGIALGGPTGSETELAEELCRRVPSLERVRFCNSGTEATLHAIRLARGSTGKPKIAKFEGGYHGSHDSVEISVAPPLDLAGPADAPVAVPAVRGMSPGAVSDTLILPYNDEAAVERILTAHRDELACVMFDPRAGILPQRREFVQFVRDLTARLGILLVFDEIVGFRVGSGGLQVEYGITPDLSTYGKIIGGGFPVGAFGGRADLMDLLDTSQGPTGYFQSGTFSAHPVAMAAGLATLRQLTPPVLERINALGARLASGLRTLFERRGVPAQVVCTGSLFSIHFSAEPVVDYRSLARTDKALAGRVFRSLLAQGQYLSQGLSMSALSVPMNEAHVDGLVTAIDQSISER